MAEKRIWGTLDPFFEGGAILGRKMANTAFLDALLLVDPFDEYHFFLPDEAGAGSLREALAGKHPGLERRGAFRFLLRAALPDELRRRHYHCFHLSDFVTRHPAVSLIRNKYSPRLFPVTSVTHSLSYNDYMTAFLEHLWPGASERDAIVMTSRSAVSVFENAFLALRKQYGITCAGPGLPRIPLGVSAKVAPPSESVVRDMRRRLAEDDRNDRNNAGKQGEAGEQGNGGQSGELLFLCLSRISAQSKMDFLPVFAACKRAEKLGLVPGSYRLVFAGWLEDDDAALPAAFAGIAASLGIRFSLVARPTALERDALYHMADVFLSPSDNIQETFGLTVIEAGAAGTPVIVSDFDGYMDTVIHEVTGLRVPVCGFGGSCETSALSSVWMHNQYHFKLAQETAVDVPQMGAALARLALDEGLRKRMGEAAKRHVAENFDWPGVIARYCELWDDLWTVQIDEERERALRTANHPLQMDFARLFRGHFTKTIDVCAAEGMVIKRTPFGEAFYRGVFPSLPYAGLDLMLDKEVLRRLLLLARKPVTAATALQELSKLLTASAGGEELPPLPAPFIEERAAFILLWALKQDLVEKV